MATYSGRFECSICQGTLAEGAFCSLSCGHCFHSVCIYTWIERSPTCPSCRASASKKKIRALNGIEAVSDTESDQAHAEQQHVSQLECQLKSAEQQIASLGVQVRGLHDEQASMQQRLARYKLRCQELEAKRLEDAERLTCVTLELSKLRETHVTMVERLRREVVTVRQKAAADVAHFKLQHPSLNLEDMQRLIGFTGQASESQQQLLAILAQRNKQLQQAEARAMNVQQQLDQQQRRTDTELAAAISRQQAVELEADKAKRDALRAVIELEYENNKLQQANKAQQKQVQELQDVLLALQGTTSSPQRHRPDQLSHAQQHKQCHQQAAAVCSPRKLSHCKSGTQCMQPAATSVAILQCGTEQHQHDGASEPLGSPDDWMADVAVAVGPRQTADAPSFVKPGVCMAQHGGAVQGQLLRHGPDGKGGLTSSAAAAASIKRVGIDLAKTTSKRARSSTAATRNITSFFSKSSQSSSGSSLHRL